MFENRLFFALNKNKRCKKRNIIIYLGTASIIKDIGLEAFDMLEFYYKVLNYKRVKVESR